MAKKDPDAFFDLLDAVAKGGELPAIVALGGAERVFIDDALAVIRTHALAGGMADFNHDRMSARDRDAADILSLARTLPVMARRRLVEVRDADQLRDADVESLEGYVQAPCRETVLLFLFGDLDFRDKLPKLLDKAKGDDVIVVRFDHPKEREMPRLVERRARRQQLRLTAGAADALAVTVGTDLTLLERALEKLALVAPDGVVDVAMVSQHVADTHLEDAFAFVRAVARGDRAEATRGVAALQAAREEPLRLLGLLAWQLRQVMRARLLEDQGRDVARELNLFGDRLQGVMAGARRFDVVGHEKRLVRLAEADLALKSSRQPPWLLFTRLVQDLCPPPPTTTKDADGGSRAARPRR